MSGHTLKKLPLSKYDRNKLFDEDLYEEYSSNRLLLAERKFFSTAIDQKIAEVKSRIKVIIGRFYLFHKLHNRFFRF